MQSNIPDGAVKMEVDEDDSGQEFDPGDSDQDSGASLSACGRKRDRGIHIKVTTNVSFLYSRFECRFKNFFNIFNPCLLILLSPF